MKQLEFRYKFNANNGVPPSHCDVYSHRSINFTDCSLTTLSRNQKKKKQNSRSEAQAGPFSTPRTGRSTLFPRVLLCQGAFCGPMGSVYNMAAWNLVVIYERLFLENNKPTAVAMTSQNRYLRYPSPPTAAITYFSCNRLRPILFYDWWFTMSESVMTWCCCYWRMDIKLC